MRQEEGADVGEMRKTDRLTDRQTESGKERVERALRERGGREKNREKIEGKAENIGQERWNTRK